MESDTSLIYLLVAALGLVLLFTIGRIITLWFYKIEDRLKETQRTNELIELLLNHYKIQHPNSLVKVRELKTGEIKTMKLSNWNDHYKIYKNKILELVE